MAVSIQITWGLVNMKIGAQGAWGGAADPAFLTGSRACGEQVDGPRAGQMWS